MILARGHSVEGSRLPDPTAWRFWLARRHSRRDLGLARSPDGSQVVARRGLEDSQLKLGDDAEQVVEDVRLNALVHGPARVRREKRTARSAGPCPTGRA